MTVSSGESLVTKFEGFKQRLKDRKRRKSQDRIMRKVDKNNYHNFTGVKTGYSKEYAEGWDRIFGKKEE